MLTGLELYRDPEGPDQIWSQIDDQLYLRFTTQVKMPREEWLKCFISNKILIQIVHRLTNEIEDCIKENTKGRE